MAFQKALKDELDVLGASYLPLTPKTTRADGEVYHKLVFTKGSLPKKVVLTDILSEGEQRVVAIAGFLAELSASNSLSPIVLDDPVSSLDHKFRDRIAKRFAQEGGKRQIIIFTHDISFLLELEEQCARIGKIKMTAQTIRRKGEVCGTSSQGTPWHAMKVSERIGHLNGKVNSIASFFTDDRQKYNEEAATLYGKLRETWEAFVEERLLNRVVRRFSSGIQTLSLNEVDVTTDDYRAIYFAMTKCSEWMTGHDRSKALDVDRPSPKEFRVDIEELSRIGTIIKERREQVKNDRRQAISPMTTEVG